MNDIEYGVFEGYPACWNDREAWVCWRGEWKDFPPMEVWFNARVVSAAEYHKLFAPVPELFRNPPNHVRGEQKPGVTTGIGKVTPQVTIELASATRWRVISTGGQLGQLNCPIAPRADCEGLAGLCVRLRLSARMADYLQFIRPFRGASPRRSAG